SGVSPPFPTARTEMDSTRGQVEDAQFAGCACYGLVADGPDGGQAWPDLLAFRVVQQVGGDGDGAALEADLRVGVLQEVARPGGVLIAAEVGADDVEAAVVVREARQGRPAGEAADRAGRREHEARHQELAEQ